jgi:hypothetical protein
MWCAGAAMVPVMLNNTFRWVATKSPNIMVSSG